MFVSRKLVAPPIMTQPVTVTTWPLSDFTLVFFVVWPSWAAATPPARRSANKKAKVSCRMSSPPVSSNTAHGNASGAPSRSQRQSLDTMQHVPNDRGEAPASGPIANQVCCLSLRRRRCPLQQEDGGRDASQGRRDVSDVSRLAHVP